MSASGNRRQKNCDEHCRCEWCWDGRERKRKIIDKLHSQEMRES